MNASSFPLVSPGHYIQVQLRKRLRHVDQEIHAPQSSRLGEVNAHQLAPGRLLGPAPLGVPEPGRVDHGEAGQRPKRLIDRVIVQEVGFALRLDPTPTGVLETTAMSVLNSRFISVDLPAFDLPTNIISGLSRKVSPGRLRRATFGGWAAAQSLLLVVPEVVALGGVVRVDLVLPQRAVVLDMPLAVDLVSEYARDGDLQRRVLEVVKGAQGAEHSLGKSTEPGAHFWVYKPDERRSWDEDAN